ncbi:hypothetical protein HDV05_003161, partial [Chytridiales sp. JEL 0842]
VAPHLLWTWPLLKAILALLFGLGRTELKGTLRKVSTRLDRHGGRRTLSRILSSAPIFVSILWQSPSLSLKRKLKSLRMRMS